MNIDSLPRGFLAALAKSDIFRKELDKNDAATVAERSRLIKSLKTARARYDAMLNDAALARIHALADEIARHEQAIQDAEEERFALVAERTRTGDVHRDEIRSLRAQIAEHVPLAVSTLREEIAQVIASHERPSKRRDELLRLDTQLAPYVNGEVSEIDNGALDEIRRELKRLTLVTAEPEASVPLAGHVLTTNKPRSPLRGPEFLVIEVPPAGNRS